MKRSFVYLILALALSLLLCACGNMSDDGRAVSSHWPDVTTPVIPSPSANVTGTATPDARESAAPDMMSASPMPDMTASPRPTEQN